MHVPIYETPDTVKKIGYLRLGTVVSRSDTPYGNANCPGGWYGIAPRGFVCSGKYASIDDYPLIVKAASVRPDTSKPLPYAYGFVRSVSPLYLRVPSRAEQKKQEYKIENHFRWFANHPEEQRVGSGANEHARELIPDAAVVPPAEDTPDGVLLGGKSNADPPPFWIENGNRAIPNVQGFDVKPESFFANMVKRHTGVSFIGTFDAGDNLDHRRFAVTVDLRLLPIDKVKPEVGSPFHGVEITPEMKLPLAFARPCDPKKRGEEMKACRRIYRKSENGKRMKRESDVIPSRAFLQLTGVREVFDDVPYYETKAGYWMRERDLAIAMTPHRWPGAAERGEKWIDVAIVDEVLVMWEGKKPVFTTLVSAGQDGVKDPKNSKATIRGFFRLKSKHITATMDSGERSSVSGGAPPDPNAGEAAAADDQHDTSFELRDVPYVQYFHEGYAIHSAYWHDRFGIPRSHGCINLAPIDAMRVFRFTDPPVPDGWHGVQIDPNKGTVVIVHP
ncbi:MAG: L,D-transpeptidase [Labilithrix sp.]|nr:L,D-transpeptidase [Labilithrix sp.]MCW5811376.1 L,D-transpeptidase [Labilithrix sp.]